MNRYELETQITLAASFTRQEDSSPQDPSTVRLFLSDPNGHITSVTGTSLAHPDTGSYAYTLTPDIMGRWTYKWLGTGSVQVSSPDTQFEIERSRFSL